MTYELTNINNIITTTQVGSGKKTKYYVGREWWLEKKSQGLEYGCFSLKQAEKF